MSDNNRLELDIVAHDDTGPATAKARANFRSVEAEAARSAVNMSKGFDAQAVEMGRSIDKAAASALRSLDALERRAALAGKSAVEKLVVQRNQMIASLGSDEPAIQRAMSAYDKLISARQKYEEKMRQMDSGGGHSGHGVGSMALRRSFLAAKDFGEGRMQGVFAEVADIAFGQGGTGGVVQAILPKISEITGLSNGAVIAVGALAGAFGALGFAGIHAMHSLAEAGQEIQKFSLSTGIAPTRVQAFQFAAKAAGADPSVFQRISSEISRAADDYSEEGTKKREQLGRLGVNLYDRFGDLKPTEQVLLGVADGLDKLSPGLERNAAAARLFGENGKEVLPVLEGLRRNLATSDEIGNTFSEHDLAMMERWHESLTRMGEEWNRFKLSLEVPLGITGEVLLKGIRFLGMPSGGLDIGGSYGKELGEWISSHLFQEGEITPPSPGRDDLRRSAEKGLSDQARERYLALRRQDPAYRLSEERSKLNQLDATARHGSAEDNEAATEQYRLVKSLEAHSESNRALEGVVAARKERLQLEAQYAEIQQSSQQKLLSASINPSRELSTPGDIAKQLGLAEARVNAEQQKILNDRRYRVDDKTGTIRDLSGTPEYQKFAQEEAANLPLRIRNEYAKALGELQAQDARYFAARTDADGKAWEQAWQRRKKGEMDLQDEEIRTRQSIQSRQFDLDGQSIDRQREMALQGLDGVNAQTLKEKIALEDAKLGIEQSFAERSAALQIAKLRNQEALAVAEIQKKAAESGNTGTDAEAADVAAKQSEYQQQIDAVRAATSDRELIDAQKTQTAKEKLQIESSRRVYDSLKHDAEGLFDQLVYHTQSWGDFFKGIFKATVMTPLKEIFSSQVSALFTKGLTGQDVSFGEVGNGEGKFGKLGSIFGRAGLGQPRFGDANHPLAKLNAPNHLGDVSLMQGAVPVVIMNAPQVGAAHAQAASSGYGSIGAALASSFGLSILSGARNIQQIGAQGSTYGIGESTWNPVYGSNGVAQALSPNGFPTMGEVAALGTPSGLFSAASDNPWVLPTPPPFNAGLAGTQLADWTSPNLGPEAAMTSPQSGGILSKIGGMFGLGNGGSVQGTPPFVANGHQGGILGNIFGGGKGGFLGGFKSMFGLDTAGTDMGNGVGIARTGFGGNLAAISKSGGFAMIGGGLALDGIRRGGVLGTLEAAGGGAMVGFKYGGPIGAVVGAAIGGGIAAFKSLFGGDDRKHVKKLVKEVYGMDISNGIADQIIQIAKQRYGGEHDVAVRSPEVRDLLKLYAQTTGQKSAEDKFAQEKIHSASLVESGGKLFQSAVYDNGNAYSYSSPLSVYGGVQTSPLSTYAPNNGYFGGTIQLNVNGQSAADLLEGRISKTVTPGFVQGQALSASNSSVGRTAQQNMTLSPSALTR